MCILEVHVTPEAGKDQLQSVSSITMHVLQVGWFIHKIGAMKQTQNLHTDSG